MPKSGCHLDFPSERFQAGFLKENWVETGWSLPGLERICDGSGGSGRNAAVSGCATRLRVDMWAGKTMRDVMSIRGRLRGAVAVAF